MLAHQRHQLILGTLEKRASLGIPELGKLLGASPATVRRDLVFLEKIGKIARTHGAILHPSHANSELSFDRRSRSELNAKTAIAEAAAALVRPGQTLFIDAGSTALEAGKRILQKPGVTVFTNSIPLLGEPPADGSRLIALGGEVRALSSALVGAGALDWAARITLDIAFLGASGIEPAHGPCTTELSEAAVKRTAAARARRVVLLADSSKWETAAAIRYADWTQIHDIITNRPPSAAIRSHLKKNSPKLRLHIAAK